MKGGWQGFQVIKYTDDRRQGVMTYSIHVRLVKMSAQGNIERLDFQGRLETNYGAS